MTDLQWRTLTGQVRMSFPKHFCDADERRLILRIPCGFTLRLERQRFCSLFWNAEQKWVNADAVLVLASSTTTTIEWGVDLATGESHLVVQDGWHFGVGLTWLTSWAEQIWSAYRAPVTQWLEGIDPMTLLDDCFYVAESGPNDPEFLRCGAATQIAIEALPKFWVARAQPDWRLQPLTPRVLGVRPTHSLAEEGVILALSPRA